APLEVFALLRDLLETRLLLLVFLPCEGVDAAELLTATFQALESGDELVALALRGLGSGLIEAAAHLSGLGLESGDLDVDLRRALASRLRFELEQKRLGRLAGEPELAAVGVVAEAFPGHGGPRRVEEIPQRHDRELGDDLTRIPPDQDDEAAQAGRSCPLEQRE